MVDTGASLRRHFRFQLLQPIEDDMEFGRVWFLPVQRWRILEEKEPLSIGRHVVVATVEREFIGAFDHRCRDVSRSWGRQLSSAVELARIPRQKTFE
jgi:hypothetical protein